MCVASSLVPVEGDFCEHVFFYFINVEFSNIINEPFFGFNENTKIT